MLPKQPTLEDILRRIDLCLQHVYGRKGQWIKIIAWGEDMPVISVPFPLPVVAEPTDTQPKQRGCKSCSHTADTATE